MPRPKGLTYSIGTKEHYRDYESRFSVDFETFEKIIKTFFTILFSEMLVNAKIFKFPMGIGKMGILRCKVRDTKRRRTDWGNSALNNEYVKYVGLIDQKHIVGMGWWALSPYLFASGVKHPTEFKLNRDKRRMLADYVRDTIPVSHYYANR